MLHLPIVRAGKAYRSLDEVQLKDLRTGEAVAAVSQANPGLIARDLNRSADARRTLARTPVAELIAVCRRAAKLFVEADLPLAPGEGAVQSPQEYLRCQSATTGLPVSLCRANMEKNRLVLAEMESVLSGLTRGIDLEVLDRGYTEEDGRPVSYLSQAGSLGAILPSNSPGVHSLWMPAVPLKTPLVLKPGRQEPWTPLRVTNALLAAGCPPEAVGFYPTNYSGATEILLRTDRSMLFGDENTVRPWRHQPKVQLHGPGWSKVLLGDDRVADWARFLDVMVDSVAINGGRSCLNASGVWVPSHGREVADALARRLAGIEARSMDDPQASLAAFSDPRVAHAISEHIDAQLEIEGAVDLTAAHRPQGRVVVVDRCTYLLPTVVWCERIDHPLASSEYLFPFVSVVECPTDRMLQRIGPTLVGTAITEDPELVEALMACTHIDRLNLGAIPTTRISWEQPHEGNLFEHLYRRRSLQMAGRPSAA